MFSNIIFKMQPNTRKYFPFPKIFSPKNILHPKNTLHWNKCSLNAQTKLFGHAQEIAFEYFGKVSAFGFFAPWDSRTVGNEGACVKWVGEKDGFWVGFGNEFEFPLDIFLVKYILNSWENVLLRLDSRLLAMPVCINHHIFQYHEAMHGTGRLPWQEP